MNLQIGTVIGDYEVIGLLGRGGMGSVFKVRNLISDRIEALKVVLQDVSGSPELSDRFAREIKVHASLDHPNIASLHTALRVDNQLLMLMEYVEGISLEDFRASRTVGLWEGVEYICQVLSALSYAHSRGVIHRDIKPPNIMITHGRLVKLVDFGIAASANRRKLTQSGALVGSLSYMSPEQVKSGAVDGRSDLYSVGVTLYEMVTGVRPFRGESEFAIMRGHLEVQPTAPVELNVMLPQELSTVILRALEKASERRFQTAEEFRSALLWARARGDVGPTGQMPVVTAVRTDVATAPPRATPTPTGARPTDPGCFEPAVLDKVKKELGVFIGPMARVLVNRAVKNAATVQQLYDILASEIGSESDRRKFLAGRPK